MKHYTDDKIIDRLLSGAEALFNARANMRREHDMLQDVYGDATSAGPGLYADPFVKQTRDMIHALDREIGDVARQMEHLAREIKRSRAKFGPTRTR